MISFSLHSPLVPASPQRSSKPFFPETLLSIAVQIARALQFIHSQGPDWVHGSLGSATVLLDALMNVKVADIGFSRLKAYAEIMLVKRMFSEWSAPEVFKGANPSQASDCWAFGVIVWELITRKQSQRGEQSSIVH
jgi:serine/threonine protein kinase